MNKISFEDFRDKVERRSKERGIIHLQAPAGRAIRTKPRERAELELLVRLALKRKTEALKSGEYKIVASRRWIIHDRNNQVSKEGR